MRRKYAANATQSFAFFEDGEYNQTHKQAFGYYL